MAALVPDKFETKLIFCFCSQLKCLPLMSLFQHCVFVVFFSCSLPFSFQLSAKVPLPLNYVNCCGHFFQSGKLYYGRTNSVGAGARCRLFRLLWPLLGCRDACCPTTGIGCLCWQSKTCLYSHGDRP